MTLSHYASFRLLLVVTVSQTLFFFLMTLTLLRSRSLQNVSQFRVYVFFSCLNCVYDFGRGRWQSQNVIKVTSYQGHLLSMWLIAVNANFEHRANVVFTGFFTMKSLFFHSRSMLYSLKESHFSQAILNRYSYSHQLAFVSIFNQILNVHLNIIIAQLNIMGLCVCTNTCMLISFSFFFIFQLVSTFNILLYWPQIYSIVAR